MTNSNLNLLTWEDIQSLASILKRLDDEQAAIILMIILTYAEKRAVGL